MKQTDRVLLTKEEVEKAFAGTNFGDEKPIDTIKWSLLKIAAGYATGSTAMSILQELKLASKSKNLTPRGKYCLWDFFCDGYRG